MHEGRQCLLQNPANCPAPSIHLDAPLGVILFPLTSWVWQHLVDACYEVLCSLSVPGLCHSLFFVASSDSLASPRELVAMPWAI